MKYTRPAVSFRSDELFNISYWAFCFVAW